MKTEIIPALTNGITTIVEHHSDGVLLIQRLGQNPLTSRNGGDSIYLTYDQLRHIAAKQIITETTGPHDGEAGMKEK